jgi:hypothetical protein
MSRSFAPCPPSMTHTIRVANEVGCGINLYMAMAHQCVSQVRAILKPHPLWQILCPQLLLYLNTCLCKGNHCTPFVFVDAHLDIHMSQVEPHPICTRVHPHTPLDRAQSPASSTLGKAMLPECPKRHLPPCTVWPCPTVPAHHHPHSFYIRPLHSPQLAHTSVRHPINMCLSLPIHCVSNANLVTSVSLCHSSPPPIASKASPAASTPPHPMLIALHEAIPCPH